MKLEDLIFEILHNVGGYESWNIVENILEKYSIENVEIKKHEKELNY